jgi:hypothetical protein
MPEISLPQANDERIDGRLIAAIREGRCVAFVGAGFSAAAGLPRWGELIRFVASEQGPGPLSAERAWVSALLDRQPPPSSRELEMAAQLLYDALGEEVFCARLREALRAEPLPEAMRLRLKHLRGIPFRAIVTTNFDPLLPGMAPSPEAYRRLLREGRSSSPWREAVTRVALGEGPADAPWEEGDSLVVQLHGRIDDARSLVLTRAQYQRHLYGHPAYLTVLRALLGTSTVLFLGYSLTDAYLNEVRSELVEAFGGGGAAGEPLAWAIIEGVSEVACRYYERHEGLGVIPYTRDENGGHGAFDDLLRSIYERTNPIHRLGQLLRNRRVLWFDPHPERNALGRALMHAAVVDCGEGGQTCLEEVATFDEVQRCLAGPGTFDVVISHWGDGLQPDGRSNAEALLREVSAGRAEGHPVAPVLIFAGSEHEAENRRRALTLGAAEYVSSWADLMAVLERTLAETVWTGGGWA